MKAKRLHSGHYEYKGWEIEKMAAGQWNMRPINSDCWCDAAATLTEAKTMIKRFSK